MWKGVSNGDLHICMPPKNSLKARVLKFVAEMENQLPLVGKISTLKPKPKSNQ